MDALLLAAICAAALLIAYSTYGRWVAGRVFTLREDAPTPAVLYNDKTDYCPTRRSVVFGHHFTSIAGTGPIVGPAIAVMWGWLPAVIWVIVGSIFIGAVHDLGSLVVSLRNKGRTIGDIAGDLLGPRVRLIFLAVLVMGLWIVLAIFGLVIAAVLKQYPSAVFPVHAQIPIAVVIGCLVHRKGGNLLIPSAIALALMYASVIWGDWGPLHTFNTWAAAQPTWAWVVWLLVYSYVASVIPVWLLLQPRDYINALQLVSALGLLVAGLIGAAFLGGAPDDIAISTITTSSLAADAAHSTPIVAAPVERPPLRLVAPLFDLHPPGAPPLVPLLFITIACGAISGFHCLVSSGTTSKQIKKETDALPVGYGSMLTEGFLAILVIIACAAGIGLGVTKGIDVVGTGSPGDETYFFGHVSFPRADGSHLHLSTMAKVQDVDVPRLKPIGLDPETFSVVSHIGAVKDYNGFGVVGDGSGVFAMFLGPDGQSVQADHTQGENTTQINVDDQVATLNPEDWTYRVDGPLAFRKQYESWSSAGGLSATVGAFVNGSANLIQSLGIPLSVAVALMGVLVASFAGTTMDTACRLQRYVIQELARTFLPRTPDQPCNACGYDLSGLTLGIDAHWTCPECGAHTAQPAQRSATDPNSDTHPAAHAGLAAQRALASNLNPFKWLATPHGATLFAVVTAAALAAIPPAGKPLSLADAGAGGMILWPLFGATNQLLAGMAFLVIGAWLIATKRPIWFIILPTLFMIIMPAWALIWQAFVGDANTPAWWTDRKWLLVAIAGATLALEAWLLIEVAARMLRARAPAQPAT